MKTIRIQQFLMVALLALVATAAQARSWRINHDAMQAPDFTDINAAMASSDVVEGDTLYLDPGCGLTTEQHVSKQVTIIGCGYFRAEAPHAMASVLNNLWVAAPYTKIEGVVFSNNVNIMASNVVLERCKVSGNIIVASTDKYNGSYRTAQNVTIRQCYAVSVSGAGGTDMRSAYCTIENSILLQNGSKVMWGLYFPTIKNCYLRQANNNYIFDSVSHATVVNTIMLNTRTASVIWYNSDSELDQNNISSATTGNTEANIFALEGADDHRYQLKDDSPAKGAGADGTDCGPFGGDAPYVIGGLPAGHPYYTKATIAPRSENDQVKVSLQIKMQDE